MFHPEDEGKVLRILTEVNHRAFYELPYPNKDCYDRDPALLKVVNLYSLVTSHANKLNHRFKMLNRDTHQGLAFVPSSLARISATVGRVLDDTRENKQMKMRGLVTVFNFQEGSRYLFRDKFFKRSELGIFIGVEFEDEEKVYSPLFEQLYSAVRSEVEDVQLV